MTNSGYAYVIKIVGRTGQPQEIFRGQQTDVSARASVLRGEGKVDGILVPAGVTFFESEYSLYAGGKLTPIALPRKAEYQAYVDGRIVFTLQEA